jgi:hypothetical protein
MNHEIISNLFLYFQSAYGNSFISQFSNGQIDKNGEDVGLKTAISVWAEMLEGYSQLVIETAAKAAVKSFKDFPPNLSNFNEVCLFLARRIEPQKPQSNRISSAPKPIPRFLAESEKMNDGKDWAREIMETHRRGVSVAPFPMRLAMRVLGIKA